MLSNRADGPSRTAISKGRNGTSAIDHEAAVLDRYSAGALKRVEELCCPVTYDPRYLEILPSEILERDYGCGDPSVYVERGETVLDLGCGGGKICYILSQKVGPEGRVIGIDMNEEMLNLAEKYRLELAEKIGWSNVEFKRGRIQDLQTDLGKTDRHLAKQPITDLASLRDFEDVQARQRESTPLVADSSIDVVVSNCVLNLVRNEDKEALFHEIFRVVKRGGRVVISDIVADEDVPESMLNDPELWSGCISGALREDLFIQAFTRAGFHGMEVLQRDENPWCTVEGIEFRSMTLVAWKGKQGPCYEKNQAVIYKGPFSAVEDDDGHRYPRGERMAVCEKTFELLRRGSYRDQMIFIEPLEPIAEQIPFDCTRMARRHPRETKGAGYNLTTEITDCCGSNNPCC